jgi:hypothetical protein
MKEVVCGIILFVFMLGLQQALFHLADSVEFSSFMAICVGICSLTVAAAFGWDWLERRH